MSWLRPPDRAIRVVLAEQKGLMRDFVKLAIAKQSDMEIVGEVSAANDLSTLIANEEVDVVVTALSSPQVPEAYHALPFGALPVCVLAISRDRHHVAVYERRIIREVSDEQFIGVIREVGRRKLLVK